MADQGLAALRDIHLPGPISIWPLAIGWYFLAGVILVILAGIAILIARRRRITRARRAALQELRQCPDDLSRISDILRRTALAYYPQHDVASLQGTAWIAFLNSTSKKPIFTEISAALTMGCYQKNAKADFARVRQICRQWLKQVGWTKSACPPNMDPDGRPSRKPGAHHV